jgi:hypothetical protein
MLTTISTFRVSAAAAMPSEGATAGSARCPQDQVALGARRPGDHQHVAGPPDRRVWPSARLMAGRFAGVKNSSGSIAITSASRDSALW